MRIKRVVDSVLLCAVLPAAGVIACGQASNGPDQNPTPGPGTQYPTGTPPPVIGGGAPPVIGGGGTPPPGATTPPPGGTTLPPPGGTTLPPPGGTTLPPPGGTTLPPPGGTTLPPPGGTTTAPPGGTTTAPPGGTTTPPTSTLPPIQYDANHILLPPDPSIGGQIATPTFSLAPGSEVFRCYHTSIASSTETDVQRWVSQMTPGSHHFILYAGGTAPDGQMDMNGCAGGLNNQWVYASSSPDNQLPMPQGVAMPMAANQKINFDMHYINTTSGPLDVHILLNYERATGTFQRAGALVSFNTSIAVPPNGTQTVSGTCTVPSGANFFLMSTHTHKHATLATIHVGSAQGQELVHTTDWENPAFTMWQTAPFFNFPAGQGLYYACTYQNNTASTIYVGTSAITNEMCMAVTYYFPAAGGGGISCF